MRLPWFSHRLPYHSLRRWLTQPLAWTLFFLSPAFNLFRVDMLRQQLWWLGRAYPFELPFLQWLPIGFYGGVLAIALSSVVLGRWFCGWTCPHNALTEWTRPLRMLVGREPLSNRLKRVQRFQPRAFWVIRWLSPLLALALTLALSACLASFIVSPRWIVSQWSGGHPHVALVFGQGLFTVIGLFLLYCGHDFCRTCCPYGMGQSISAYVGHRWRPMEIRYTGQSPEADCGTCTACQQLCPVVIDPRLPENLKVGQFEGCFNCGECIDACAYVHTHHHQLGLLQFAPPRMISPHP